MLLLVLGKGQTKPMPMGIRVMLWGPLPKGAHYYYASHYEMTTCSTRTKFARGPAGVTVCACPERGPNSCYLPRAPILLNSALGGHSTHLPRSGVPILVACLGPPLFLIRPCPAPTPNSDLATGLNYIIY